METKKYDFLDSLRWIAILLVLVVHLHYIWLPIGGKLWFGVIWVPLFFMVSAYTLALSQDNQSTNQDPNMRKKFFIKRVFRIFPLFFVVISGIFAWSYIYPEIFWYIWEHITWVVNYLAHIFFVYGFSPLTMNTFGIWEWSLFSEIFFYCLFPFIFAFAGKSAKNSYIWLWVSLWIYILWNGLTLLAQSKWLTSWFAEWSTYIYHFPLYHFVDFALGFVLLWLHKKYFDNKISSQTISLISIIHLLAWWWVIYMYTRWVYINHILRLVILFGLVFVAMQWWWIYKILLNRVSEYFGKISYSLYLLNLPVFAICAKVIQYYDINIYIWTVSTALLLIWIASISYKFEIWWMGLWKKVSNILFPKK